MENKVLTRAQRRMQERYETEAKQTYESLAEKFLNYFTQCDNPEAPEVEEKRKQINAQWIVYCRKMKLVDAARMMFDNYSKGVVKDYYEQKEPAKVISE